LSAAERKAHTVKGVAANLGVKTVQLAAGELEKAIHDGADAARVESLREEFATVLIPFVDRLRAALGEERVPCVPAKAIVVNPARLKLMVEQMTEHLGEFDVAALDCLEANRDVFASLFSAEEFATFEQHVHGYAFSEALSQLKRAAQVPRV
jgi:HPt (histidine-containing phosphotransfer) domain-containing protein